MNTIRIYKRSINRANGSTFSDIQYKDDNSVIDNYAVLNVTSYSCKETCYSVLFVVYTTAKPAVVVVVVVM